MVRFTKKLRQKIVDEFSTRHNGQYNPELFLREVQEKGPEHPAYGWFEWDSNKAAHEHNLWQARSFAKDLRIVFEVEQVGRSGTMTVVQQEMPTVLSPVAGRNGGGGYVLTDPDNPEHMAEHCRQAGTALRSWLKRYSAALMHVDGSIKPVERIAEALERVEAPKEEKAA